MWVRNIKLLLSFLKSTLQPSNVPGQRATAIRVLYLTPTAHSADWRLKVAVQQCSTWWIMGPYGIILWDALTILMSSKTQTMALIGMGWNQQRSSRSPQSCWVYFVEPWQTPWSCMSIHMPYFAAVRSLCLRFFQEVIHSKLWIPKPRIWGKRSHGFWCIFAVQHVGILCQLGELRQFCSVRVAGHRVHGFGMLWHALAAVARCFQWNGSKGLVKYRWPISNWPPGASSLDIPKDGDRVWMAAISGNISAYSSVCSVGHGESPWFLVATCGTTDGTWQHDWFFVDCTGIPRPTCPGFDRMAGMCLLALSSGETHLSTLGLGEASGAGWWKCDRNVICTCMILYVKLNNLYYKNTIFIWLMNIYIYIYVCVSYRYT